MDGKKKVAKKKATKKKVTKKKSAKRPAQSKFDEKLLPVISNLMKRGWIDIEIVEVLGITEKTFYNWKKKYPESFQSEGDWKKNANEQAERTLVRLMNGFVLREEKAFMTKHGAIKKTHVLKQLPPNQKSLEFFMTNRDHKRWKNKIEHDMGDETARVFTLAYNIGDSAKPKEEDNGKEETTNEDNVEPQGTN